MAIDNDQDEDQTKSQKRKDKDDGIDTGTPLKNDDNNK